MSTPPGCSARWHAAYSAVWADERVAALLLGVAHANLRRGGGVAVISEVLRAAELSPADGRRLVATPRACIEALTGDSGTSARRPPSPPARRNPASPAPAARQDQGTAAPHPPRRRQDNQEGTHPQSQARTHTLNGTPVGSLLRACGPNFRRSG
jgi:hypothetical protein